MNFDKMKMYNSNDLLIGDSKDGFIDITMAKGNMGDGKIDFEEFKQQFTEMKAKHTVEASELTVKFANEINEFVVVNIENVFIPDVTMLSYNDRDGEIRYLVLGVSMNTLKLRLGIYYCNGRYCNPYDRSEGEIYTIGKALKELKDVTSCLDSEMIEQAIKDDKNKKKERDLKKYREAKAIVEAVEGGAIK